VQCWCFLQTVACDHQNELTQLRNFKEAAQVCRNQLVTENKQLKNELEDLRIKYQSLSQQMALKEAEWVEAQEKAEHEQEVSVHCSILLTFILVCGIVT
jgi:hypothetical protein